MCNPLGPYGRSNPTESVVPWLFRRPEGAILVVSGRPPHGGIFYHMDLGHALAACLGIEIPRKPPGVADAKIGFLPIVSPK